MTFPRLSRLLPRTLVCGLRAAWIQVHQRGQTRRGADGNCIDAEGNPIPWMTYPSIDFLDSFDLSACRVFEFGSGSSTLFWAERCRSVCSVEHSECWFEKMRKHVCERITLTKQTDLSKYPDEIHKHGQFDIIIIDGAERMRCVRAALTHVKEGGIVILDNSEWYRNSCAFLREEGFFQMDFCGFTPLNSFTAMTSIFAKTPISFPYKQRRESWAPIGGKALNHARPDDV